MHIYTRIKAFIILHSNDSQDNIPYYYDKREMKGLKMRKRKGSGTSNYTCIILINYYVVFATLREIDNQAPTIHRMTQIYKESLMIRNTSIYIRIDVRIQI